MVTRERMNEVLELLLGEQELSPERMDMMEEFRTDYFTEDDTKEELESLRKELEDTTNVLNDSKETITALSAEIKRRFFEKAEETNEKDEPETEETEETVTIKDFSE